MVMSMILQMSDFELVNPDPGKGFNYSTISVISYLMVLKLLTQITEQVVNLLKL
jgi:hypothetical protein